MSGLADSTARPDADAGTGAGGRAGRPRRRGIWAGLVIGIIAVSGALAAVLYDRGDGDAGEEEVAPGPPEGPVEESYEWPASYDGKVWITITAADPAPRSVTIRWGPWERHFVHESDGPVSYWFTKDPPAPGDANVPATVRIDPGAEVDFDHGTPPAGAMDKSTGWDPATE